MAICDIKNFNSLDEEGLESNIKQRQYLLQSMVGNIYPHIIRDEIILLNRYLELQKDMKRLGVTEVTCDKCGVTLAIKEIQLDGSINIYCGKCRLLIVIRSLKDEYKLRRETLVCALGKYDNSMNTKINELKVRLKGLEANDV